MCFAACSHRDCWSVCLWGMVTFDVVNIGSFLFVWLKVLNFIEVFSELAFRARFVLELARLKPPWCPRKGRNELMVKKGYFSCKFQNKGFPLSRKYQYSEQKNDYYNNDYHRV